MGIGVRVGMRPSPETRRKPGLQQDTCLLPVVLTLTVACLWEPAAGGNVVGAGTTLPYVNAAYCWRTQLCAEHFRSSVEVGLSLAR